MSIANQTTDEIKLQFVNHRGCEAQSKSVNHQKIEIYDIDVCNHISHETHQRVVNYNKIKSHTYYNR